MNQELSEKIGNIRLCPFCKSADTACIKAKLQQKPIKRNMESIKAVYKMKCDNCESDFKIIQKAVI